MIEVFLFVYALTSTAYAIYKHRRYEGIKCYTAKLEENIVNLQCKIAECRKTDDNEKRIYVYMVDKDGSNNYLIDQVFDIPTCLKVAKAHSMLSHSTGYYIFKSATETKGEWNAFT